MSVLQNEGGRAELRRAWEESTPDTGTAHEEGGFVLLHPDGSLTVERWPRGRRTKSRSRRTRAAVAGTPSSRRRSTRTRTPRPSYLQGPSPSDIRAVAEDPDLRHPEYEGEYVISAEILYLIEPDGQVRPLGDTASLLGAGGE